MIRRTALAALLAVCAVLSPVAAPVAAADSGSAEFEESIATVRSGETANVTVVANETGASHRITVGSNETNFVARATVADANGDGRVALRIDTGAAGVENVSSYLSASPGDELREAEQITPKLTGPVDPGSYDLRLGPPDDPIGVGSLVVHDAASRDEAEAPPLPSDSADADAITVLPSEERVAVDPAAGQTIRGKTAYPAGTNLTVRVKSASGRQYIAQNGTTVNDAGEFAATFDFSPADPGSTFVLRVAGPNGSRETVPGRVNGTWTPPEDDPSESGGSDDPSESGGNDETSEEYPLPSDSADTDAITVLPSESSLSVESATGRVVHGETALSAGTELTVRMRSVQGRAFLRSRTVTVGEFGTFDAQFDFDGVPPGTTFVLTVRGPDGTEEKVPGRVVPCESDCDVPESTAYPVEGFGVIAVAETTQGHPGRIPLRLDDREMATLVVGGESVNYRAEVTFADGNEDGRVVVGFDTAAAGHEARTLRVVSDGDAVESRGEESDLRRLIDAGEYPIALYPGNDTSGEPIDTGALVIHEAPSAVGTDDPRPTAAASTPTAFENGSVGDAPSGGGPLDSRLTGVGGVAVGGALALVGVALILRR